MSKENFYHLQGVFIAEAGPSNAFDSGERSKAMDTEAARPQTDRLTAQALEYLGQGQSKHFQAQGGCF